MLSDSSSTAVGAPYRAYHISHHSEPWLMVEKPIYKTRGMSCSKLIERQVIQAWKRVTGATRKPQRASFLPKDFVLVTSRRRSVMCR